MRRAQRFAARPVLPRLLIGVALLCATPPADAQDAKQDLPSENPLSAIDPASLTGFRERPLFSPSRRRPTEPDVAPQAEVEPTVDEAPAAPNLRLLGIIGTPDGVSALVLDQDDDSRHTLREGDVYRAWTVTALAADGIALSRDEETLTLPVFTPTEAAPVE